MGAGVVEKRGAFFDLEKTITAHAVEQEISIDLFRRGYLSLGSMLRVAWVYLKYNLGIIDEFDDMKRHGAQVFRGRSVERDRELFAEYFERHLRYFIYPEALALIARLRAEGVRVHIVSASYRFMIEPFAAFLGIDSFYGTELEVVDGVCTGKITGTIYHQWNKARLVREIARQEALDLSASLAFGDSVSDQHMLAAVGYPAVVNPGPGLRRTAEQRRWQIMEWRSY